MTKEQRSKQIANLIGMMESQQDNFLADGSDVDADISRVLNNAISELVTIWSDIKNDEYMF